MGVKISALPSASAINSADLLAIVQNGVTRQATADLLKLDISTETVSNTTSGTWNNYTATWTKIKLPQSNIMIAFCTSSVTTNAASTQLSTVFRLGDAYAYLPSGFDSIKYAQSTVHRGGTNTNTPWIAYNNVTTTRLVCNVTSPQSLPSASALTVMHLVIGTYS